MFRALAPAVLACAILALSAAPALAQSPAFTIDQLGFMAGSWAVSDGVTIEEQWMAPGGGTMLGMSRTVGEGKTYFFEYLRIETRQDGLFYVAMPKGGVATSFKLVKLDAGGAVFENLQHDFPKRIIYRREANGGLFARIEGDGAGKEQPQEFAYQPVKAGS